MSAGRCRSSTCRRCARSSSGSVAGFRAANSTARAFAQLLAALGGYVEEARLDELQRIVDDFDFELAAERMRELCEEFDLPLAAVQA